MATTQGVSDVIAAERTLDPAAVGTQVVLMTVASVCCRTSYCQFYLIVLTGCNGAVIQLFTAKKQGELPSQLFISRPRLTCDFSLTDHLCPESQVSRWR
jgi:hypothetical protein